METTSLDEFNRLFHHPGYNATLHAVGQGPKMLERVRQIEEVEVEMKDEVFIEDNSNGAFKSVAILEERIHLLSQLTRVSVLEQSAAYMNHNISEAVRKCVGLEGKKNITHEHKWYREEVTKRWDWIQELLLLTNIHLNNGRDYHCFQLDLQTIKSITRTKHFHFNEKLKQLQVDGCSSLDILHECLSLLPEMQHVLMEVSQMARHLHERLDKIVPYYSRFYRKSKKTLAEPLMAKLMCDYAVDEIHLPRGTDVEIISQEDKTTWTVAYSLNGRTISIAIPALVLWIPPETSLFSQKLKQANEMICDSWASHITVVRRVLLPAVLRYFSDYMSEERVLSTDSLPGTKRAMRLLKEELLACGITLKGRSRHVISEQIGILDKLTLRAANGASPDIEEGKVMLWKYAVEAYRELEKTFHNFLEEKKQEASNSNIPSLKHDQAVQSSHEYSSRLYNEHLRLKEAVEVELESLKRCSELMSKTGEESKLWLKQQDIYLAKEPQKQPRKSHGKRVCIQKGPSCFQRVSRGVQKDISVVEKMDSANGTSISGIDHSSARTTPTLIEDLEDTVDVSMGQIRLVNLSFNKDDDVFEEDDDDSLYLEVDLPDILLCTKQMDQSSQMFPSRKEKDVQISVNDSCEQGVQCHAVPPYEYEDTFYQTIRVKQQQTMLDESNQATPSRHEKNVQIPTTGPLEQGIQCQPIQPYEYEETFFQSILARKQQSLVDESSQAIPSRHDKDVQFPITGPQEQGIQCQPIQPYEYEETFFQSILARRQQTSMDEITSTTALKIIDDLAYSTNISVEEGIQHVSLKQRDVTIQMSPPTCKSVFVDVKFPSPLRQASSEQNQKLRDTQTATSSSRLLDHSAFMNAERHYERAIQTYQSKERDSLVAQSPHNSFNENKSSFISRTHSEPIPKLVDRLSSGLSFKKSESFKFSNILEEQDPALDEMTIEEDFDENEDEF